MTISYPMWKDWWGHLRKNRPDPSVRSSLIVCSQAPFIDRARDPQRPPLLKKDGGRDWRTWLFMGGRGSGKTRAGAEFVRFAALFEGARRIALVGPTFADVRNVMVEGESGLMSLEYEKRPEWFPSRGVVRFSSGAEAFAVSAEDPDSLRGPQFDLAWCDEIGAWPRGQDTWDMLQMALRLGDTPRCIATTTPRPVPLIKQLVSDRSVLITRATTADNAPNLAPGFLETITRMYGGTRLGRQELGGELITDLEGALWSRKVLERCLWTGPVECERIIVAVDPPASKGPQADACGIIAAGYNQGRAIVLADATQKGVSPARWASHAAALAQHLGASEIVVEANQGGEMARHAIETVSDAVPVRLVRAIRNKRVRAAPIAALYEHGRVFQARPFPELEDELCSYGAKGFSASPDRLDAMVWAVWALLLDRRGEGRVRAL